MATINQKLVTLVRSLRDATAEGRLQWAAAGQPNSFTLSLEPGIAVIEKEEVGIGEARGNEEGRELRTNYVVSLEGRDGKVIDLEIFRPLDEGSYTTARELYDLARNNALHIDEILDRMIADVNSRRARSSELSR